MVYLMLPNNETILQLRIKVLFGRKSIKEIVKIADQILLEGRSVSPDIINRKRVKIKDLTIVDSKLIVSLELNLEPDYDTEFNSYE